MIEVNNISNSFLYYPENNLYKVDWVELLTYLVKLCFFYKKLY